MSPAICRHLQRFTQPRHDRLHYIYFKSSHEFTVHDSPQHHVKLTFSDQVKPGEENNSCVLVIKTSHTTTKEYFSILDNVYFCFLVESQMRRSTSLLFVSVKYEATCQQLVSLDKLTRNRSRQLVWLWRLVGRS